MDPEATLRLINEHGCVQALQDLVEWAAKGGILPSTMPAPGYPDIVVSARIENIEDFPEEYREMAMALNVALVNDDRSALGEYR